MSPDLEGLLARIRPTTPVPLIVIGDGPPVQTRAERLLAQLREIEPARRRKRRQSLAAVIRQMKRAGVEIAGCEIQPDGSIKIVSGKATDIEMDAPIDRRDWQ